MEKHKEFMWSPDDTHVQHFSLPGTEVFFVLWSEHVFLFSVKTIQRLDDNENKKPALQANRADVREVAYVGSKDR